MAAKLLGPGRLRLEMIKLAHDLTDTTGATEVLDVRDPIAYDGPAIQPDQRAA
jgi:hypothetical protein